MKRRKSNEINSLDVIQGALFMLLALAMVAFIASGRYVNYVTPRTVPYVLVAVFVLASFAIASFCGTFHTSVNALGKIMVVLIVPTLMLVIPVQTSSASSEGLNRAIAVSGSASTRLSGLDASKRTITISDDQFGAWYDRIDRNSNQYLGYTIVLNGFVSQDSSVGASQFTASRMLMTCCVLDMTSFGFVVDAGTSRIPKDDSWVTVTGTLAKGTIGTKSHSYQGLVLSGAKIASSTDTASGYFYYQ
ncbi:MAG: TIGR03943 family protein [Bifidobacterium sp.]|uniref:TIGR03943 family protein n=1 Tax=Bifidobacterium fermentum TaxID=3059035 RepID=A0AB39UKS4_9BIFI